MADILILAATCHIDLIPEGERLRVIGELTDDLRAAIRGHKPEIIDKLHGIPIAELKQIAGPDWLDIENDPAQIEGFASLVATRRAREHLITTQRKP